MGYSLHIERPDGREPISLEEWLAVVASKPELRSATGDTRLTNTATGEEIRIRSLIGDAEVLLPTGEWVRLFRWSTGGAVSFEADALSSPDSQPLIPVVFSLARQLGAIVLGDDGEEYDEKGFEESNFGHTGILD